MAEYEVYDMTQETRFDMDLMPEPYRHNLDGIGIGGVEWNTLSPDERFQRLDSLVGHTALVPVRFPSVPGTAWLKAEIQNGLSGSHYDRLAPLFHDMMRAGALKEGDIAVDASSGSHLNAGAVILGAAGVHAKYYIPHLPPERTAVARAANAELIEVDGYIPEVSLRMNDDMRSLQREKAADGKALWVRDARWQREYGTNVFSNRETGERRSYVNHSANPAAKQKMAAIAAETISQLEGLELRAAVFAVGNFLTINNTIPMFRKLYPGIRCFGIEDENNPSCRDEMYGIAAELRDYSAPRILGTSAHGTPVRFKDLGLLDGITTVPGKRWKLEQDWFNGAYPELASGPSSAAVIHTIRTILRNYDDPEANVFGILYDTPSKYPADY